MTIIAKNIYLADDDEDDRELFRSALEEVCRGCSLMTSSDGNELIGQLLNNNNPAPDIIFLDINMPKKNGLETLEEIRNTHCLSQIAVVIFSTSSNPDYITSARKLGANLYLVKPNSFTTLKNRICAIISGEELELGNFTVPTP